MAVPSTIATNEPDLSCWCSERRRIALRVCRAWLESFEWEYLRGGRRIACSSGPGMLVNFRCEQRYLGMIDKS